MDHRDCEQHSTLEFLKKRKEELEKEWLGLFTESPMDQDRVLQQKTDVIVVINAKIEKYCQHCNEMFCPYWTEGAGIRLRREFKVR